MPEALITGASSGIGAAFTRRLARDGYDLVLVGRDPQSLRAAADSLGPGTTTSVLVADLSTQDGIAAAANRAGDVDLLVNNAGFGNPAPFLQAPLNDELRMLRVHCEAPLRLTNAALTGMADREPADGRRRGVINVSSVAAFSGRGSYGASKAWQVSFSLGVAADLRAQGRTEHVMALCPGFTHTEFHQRAGMRVTGIPEFMWLDADRVASDAIRDFERGVSVSVPSPQYKVLAALARMASPSLAAKIGSRSGRRYD
jgi:uncharacterized protein